MHGYKWHPIEDLPEDWQSLADLEFPSLIQVWQDYRESLPPDAIVQFQGRLHREWSIETGIIEGVYSFDRGVTESLIAKGIDAALIPPNPTGRGSEYVARTIQDHLEALEGLFAFVKGDRKLTTGYVKELHQQLLRHQETFTVQDSLGNLFEKKLEKGRYKPDPNSPSRPDGSVHEYCPPEHTASEMDRLVELHALQVERGVSPELQAAWLHHAFTQIHPFQDGNGRVARALATLVLIRAGMFPLVVRREDWTHYIGALETADRGTLQPLIRLLVSSQRRALLQAVGVAVDVQIANMPQPEPSSVEEAIVAARDRLTQKEDLIPKKRLVAIETARGLDRLASKRLSDVARELDLEIGVSRDKYQFRAYSSPADTFLQRLNQSETVLHLRTEVRCSLTVFFVASTSPFGGLVSVGGRFYGPDISLELSSEPFLVNYREPLSIAEQRFRPWLEEVILKGLNKWREML